MILDNREKYSIVSYTELKKRDHTPSGVTTRPACHKKLQLLQKTSFFVYNQTSA